MNHRLFLLTLCQGFFLINNVTFIAINGLVGLSLAPQPWLATLPIMGYVVNRVVPRELLDQNIPPYLKNRIEMQDKYLKQIDDTFGSQVASRVPELERDVTGLEMIRKLSEIMYGESVGEKL